MAGILLLVSAIAVYMIEWHLFTTVRKERDKLANDISVISADRDGWRGVAERALLVAQISKTVATRATVVTHIATDRSDVPSL